MLMVFIRKEGKKLLSLLSPSVKEHCQRVAELARELAGKHNVDLDQAYIAGLYHDVAKEIPDKELTQITRTHNLYNNYFDLEFPVILHSYVGAWLVQKEMGIKDEKILQAIRLHTIASSKMTDLDKIIYISDMIEPGRKLEIAEYIKKIAFQNLDLAMLHCLNNTMKYLIDTQKKIHPTSVEARNYFLTKIM